MLYALIIGALAVGLFTPTVLATSNDGTRTIVGDIAPPVAAIGIAEVSSEHNPSDVMRVNVGLAVHNSVQLDAVIVEASTPGSPSYGQYLTRAEYKAVYAPSDQEVQAVRDWQANKGLTVLSTSPENLLISVEGTTQQLRAAFGVRINDYTAGGRSFYSNDRDPVVPANLNINWITGLNNYFTLQASSTPTTDNVRAGGYVPSDFGTAYDMPAGIDGTGQTIGFTLWFAPLQQSDLTAYATNTGSTPLVIGQAGANGIDFIPVNGSSTDQSAWIETAMDVEVAHGVTPGSHLKYWLGHTNSFADLEAAVNDAANDSSVHIVSNSWGAAADMSDPNLETSFQYADSVGTTFYFSSGDSGAGPNYPATSPYVVAVGGTTLNTNAGYTYSSETAWTGSGGFCTTHFPRPVWQTGVSAATCSGRAEPDVAADADPQSGAYVYVGGAAHQVGGTSLATPLWAGMSVIWNRILGDTGRPALGFDAPLLYSLANNPASYARDFHDVTSGSNGYSAGTGWDQVTGWGSPDLAKIATVETKLTITGPTSAVQNHSVTLQAQMVDAITSAAVSGKTVSFSMGAENCTGATNASGYASCSIIPTDAPGGYTLTASFAGDEGYNSANTSATFTVNSGPGTPASVTFSPGNATSTVGTSVTETITVEDSNGILVSDGTAVQWSITGPMSGTASISHEDLTTTNGQAVLTYTNTGAGIDTVAATAGTVPNTASASASVTWTPGPPAAVALTPGNTSVTVGNSVTETAAVKDQYGNVVADGTTVTFSVTGITTTNGSATTTGGQASFSYGAILPGTDTLTATAVGGTNPLATATITWVLPASTANASLGVANFATPYVSGSARTAGSGNPSGLLDWRSPTVSFLTLQETALVASGPDATLFGMATLSSGQKVTFRLDAVAGANTVRLRLSNGYDSGPLRVLRVTVTP